MKRWLVVFLVCATLLVSSCAHKKVSVTNVPTGVSQSEVLAWYSATGTMKEVSSVDTQITQAVIQLNKSGIFPDSDAYTATMTSLAKISRLGLEADKFLHNAPAEFGTVQHLQILAYTNAMIAELGNVQVQTVAGIKNPVSAQAVSDLVKSLQLALTTAQALSQ